MTPNHLANRTIRVAELRPGDLIFPILVGVGAMHVEIFGGNEVFDRTSFHPVNSKEPGGPRKVMATSFRPDPIKQVYRCRWPALAARAVQIARGWAAYENKFDRQRLELKEAFAKKAEALSQEARRAQMRYYFDERGRYRALKFATRIDTIMCAPGEQDGWGQGLTCAMFATTCFQAAGMEPHVTKLAQSPLVRVSDKKINLAEFKQLAEELKARGFDEIDIALYRKYLGSLHEAAPYGMDYSVGPPAAKLPGVNYYPSLYFWKRPPFHSFNFAAVMTPALLLDAKLIDVADLLQSIRADSEHWEHLGTFPDEPNPEFGKREKRAYRATLARREEEARAARLPFTRQHR